MKNNNAIRPKSGYRLELTARNHYTKLIKMIETETNETQIKCESLNTNEVKKNILEI